MSDTALYRRVVRRETHSPRSGAAITVAIVLVLVLAWIGTEAVLAALGQPPLLAAPRDAVVAVLGAVAAPVPLLTAGGVVAVIVGIVLIVIAVAPGRRGRRGGDIARTAALVDDRVIAQSIARTASHAGDVSPDQVRVTVGARRIRVDVTRTSGRDPRADDIQAAVDADVSRYDYRPALRARVHVSEKGIVG